jgi:hypothetical protein
MAQLRAAIGDDAERPSLVRTVHRFGYAFCGVVAEAGPAARRPSGVVFRLFWGPREVELSEGSHVLGRTPGCSFWIDAPGVSRRHARIVVAGDVAVIEDLGSKNGTFLGARRLEGPSPLADGDEIALGVALLTIRVLRADRSTETVSRR